MRKNALEAQKEANWTETREVLDYFSLKSNWHVNVKNVQHGLGKTA
jgi:hypothetical protein